MFSSSQWPLHPSQHFYYEKWRHKQWTFTKTWSSYEHFRYEITFHVTFQLFVNSLYCKPYVYLVHFNVLCTYLKHIFNRNGDTNIVHLLRVKAGGLKVCMSVSGMEELGTWHFLWCNGEIIGMLSGFCTVRFTRLKLSANSLPILRLPIPPAEVVCQFDLSAK